MLLIFVSLSTRLCGTWHALNFVDDHCHTYHALNALQLIFLTWGMVARNTLHDTTTIVRLPDL